MIARAHGCIGNLQVVQDLHSESGYDDTSTTFWPEVSQNSQRPESLRRASYSNQRRRAETTPSSVLSAGDIRTMLKGRHDHFTELPQFPSPGIPGSMVSEIMRTSQPPAQDEADQKSM